MRLKSSIQHRSFEWHVNTPSLYSETYMIRGVNPRSSGEHQEEVKMAHSIAHLKNIQKS